MQLVKFGELFLKMVRKFEGGQFRKIRQTVLPNLNPSINELAAQSVHHGGLFMGQIPSVFNQFLDFSRGIDRNIAEAVNICFDKESEKEVEEVP